MKSIVIVGCGSRECAVLMKFINTNYAKTYTFYTVGTYLNPFMVENSTFLLVNSLTSKEIMKLTVFDNDVELVFIGPEQPIVEGLVDKLEMKGIFCIAPKKNMALIESSKAFTRNLLEKNNMMKYNPIFKVVKKDTMFEDLMAEIEHFNKQKVIKKNGLCGGKGVYVEGDHFSDINSEFMLLNDLKNYIKTDDIVIEEKLIGLEFSLMSLVDRKGNMTHLRPVFDYKRLYDDDKGPNTGSMGSVMLSKESTQKYISNGIIKEAEKINKNVIDALNKTNDDNYVGVLYGSFMLCKDNILKVIEFNCRLGDPEGILSLFSIEQNLIEIFIDIKNGTLKHVEQLNKNLVCVYAVPKNYALKNITRNYNIYFRGDLQKINDNICSYPYKRELFSKGLAMIYGSCELVDSHLYTSTSRTILLVGIDIFLYKAYKKVYDNIDDIIGNLRYRTDIGSKFLSNYEKAGISIDNANNSVSSIKSLICSTYNNNVMGNHGDFGGCYKLGNNELVCSIDGVGTKTHFIDTYFKNHDYESLGMDIVNHNINDILVMGAIPLLFLDYYGCSTLDYNKFIYFIRGASKALTLNGNIPLIGGETAEMPKTYNKNTVDIVGCIVGMKKSDFIKFPRQPKAHDIIVGIESDGPHTNGFSLINSIDWYEIGKSKQIKKDDIENLLYTLKKPHKNYLPFIEKFVNKYGNTSIIRMCHITGGGLLENIKRVIPNDVKIILDYTKLDSLFPYWCKMVESLTKTSRNEMYRVFNCGIGFTLILDEIVYNKVIYDNKIKITKIGYLIK